MYTEVIYLVSKGTYNYDAVGNPTPGTDVLTKIYGKLNKVGTKEFYNAVEVGIKVQYEFRIKTTNYSDQSAIRYNEKEYDIIRTLPKTRNDMILVVGKNVGEA